MESASEKCNIAWDSTLHVVPDNGLSYLPPCRYVKNPVDEGALMYVASEDNNCRELNKAAIGVLSTANNLSRERLSNTMEESTISQRLLLVFLQ